MAKPIINNYQDLMDEKQRLKANLKTGKANIHQSFNALKDEFNLFSGLKKTAKEALHADTSNPVIQFGIKRATEFLVGKVLLKRAGWFPRLVVPFVVREAASRLIAPKANKKVAEILKTAAAAIRNTGTPQSSTTSFSRK